MSTVFEKIISGEWPGRFAWTDDVCVAIATIEPTAPGHMLVVPREPWDKWTDLPEEVAAHVFTVASRIGRAQEVAFDVPRSGVVIAGFEVPHTHLHVIPLRSETDLNLALARPAEAGALDEATRRVREALVAAGFGAHVPPRMDSALLA